uniref:NADH-ubiquinone oxidoreductase chain 3 n=1 Tax=Sander canadensis TaxID=283034 RepID=R4LCI8_SANCD|nr:NADH dehydrogenase subunit 3 [Sander canadensis]AGL13503.1 NADH dehydrogenase subunit 3 [Sander canadensis]
MNLVTTVIAITSALAIILAIVSFWFTPMTPDHEKISSYQCGFDPLGSAPMQFYLRSFHDASLSLHFDLEMALLLPLPWGDMLIPPLPNFLWASAVLALLTLGLIYEWLQGGLEWAE